MVSIRCHDCQWIDEPADSVVEVIFDLGVRGVVGGTCRWDKTDAGKRTARRV